ncbi:hypothetical protein F6W79_19910 [Vibrio diabolicus]|nr:hypothetical protein F6W79_19910 [Vibrio diabolicus]
MKNYERRNKIVNKAFKSDSQRLALSLRSSIAKRRSHLNAALGAVRNFSVHFSNFSLAICSGFFGNLALFTQVLESLNP